MIMNILSYLNHSEAAFSEKIAIEDENEQITYQTLKNRAESIGTEIAKKITAINSPIIVFINRNAASICTFLGIAESHNFYVPVDAAQPIERIKIILSEIKPVMVISIHGNIPSGLDLTDSDVLEYDHIYENKPDKELLCERQKN